MQRGVLVFMLFTLCCIGLFGLFGGCKTGNDDKTAKALKEQKTQEQKLKDIINMSSDVPAPEEFSDVRYDSTIKYKKHWSAFEIKFKKNAVCEVGMLQDFQDALGLYVMKGTYKIEGNIITYDFSKQIEVKKNITMQVIKDLFISNGKKFIEDLEEGLRDDSLDEARKKKFKEMLSEAREGMRKMLAGESDIEIENIAKNIRQQAEELEKITPIKATVLADKSKIILERFVFIDKTTGERSEHKDIEFVKR